MMQMEKFKGSLPKNYTKPVWRAIMEFEMIEPNDKVLVGFSGGKDSAFLLYALRVLQTQNIIPFELAAVTVDPMFEGVSLEPAVRSLCTELGLEYYYEPLPQLAQLIFEEGQNQSPCAKCAFFRRGAINRLAVKHGFKKLALGHHHDDAVETFLMSILHSGQITTFRPVTPQDRSGITVIRPLVYLREKEIVAAQKMLPYKAVKSCCPKDGNSTRAKIKELIHNLHQEDKSIYDNLSAAMRREQEQIMLWPPLLKRDEMREIYLKKIAWKKTDND